MGRAPDAAVVVADPGAPAEELVVDGEDEREHVEVAQALDVVGVQEALAGDAVHRDGGDLAVPRELRGDEDGEDDEDRVGDDALDGVGHDEGDATAGEDDDHRERDADGQDEGEGRDGVSPEREAVRDAEQVDEEARGDGGADAVREHLAEDARDGREDAEGAVVAQLKVLPARHRARLAEAVRHVAEETREETDGPGEVVPVAHREAGLVVGFHGGHDRDDGEAVHQACGAEDVAAGDASRDEVVGDASRVAV